MPARERLERFWGRVEEKLGIGASPARSLPPTQTIPLPSSPVRALAHSPTLRPGNQGPAPQAQPYTEANEDVDNLAAQQDVQKESSPPAATSDPKINVPTPAMPEPTKLKSAWKCFDGFRQVLGGITNGAGPLKGVMDELGEIFGIYEDAAQARSDYLSLKTELEQTFSGLSVHFSGNVPPAMTVGMKNICAAIENELSQIPAQENRRVGRQYLEARKDLDDVMKCYRRIQGHLERLSLNADLSMWRIIDEQASEIRLRALTPSMSACYNSAESLQVGRRECTPETRKQVLTDLSNWRRDKTQGNLYWLNGMAGTGKTTIAGSLCAMLDRSHGLGASFFCTGLLPECRNVKLLLPTIAYQLSRFSRPFYHALSSALQSDPDLHTRTLLVQLQGMIIDPLRKVKFTLPEDLVVVIDALDECDDSQGVGQLLEILAKNAPELPLKVFLSSRPEPQIRERFGATRSKLILHELEASIVKSDIKLYFQAELTELSAVITNAELATLVNRAGVLFIYAATVVRYIKTVSSPARRQKRIREVLEVNRLETPRTDNDIDTLYNAILTSAFTSPELNDKERQTMKLVLDTVVCAQEPLTVSALAGLFRLKDQSAVADVLEPLWSVLHVSGSDSLVTALHASFPDYMLDLARSKQLGCQGQEHHGRLAELCFDRISGNRCQFNICGIESSYLTDEQVADLEERVQVAIPQDLWYACRYWAVHLEHGGPSMERLRRTQQFLENRVLLWMEVLNLKKQIGVGASIIETAGLWAKEGEGVLDLQDLVHDAWRLLTVFATNDVARSTPHLYVSMMAFGPGTGPLARCYKNRIQGLTKVEGAAMTLRQLALLGAFNASHVVLSVAFSPNGAQIASGTYDGRVQVWDGLNGKLLFDPIEGHAHGVNSVAFSPDGMHIVSGSDDMTVRLWDAQTGRQLLHPLKGHTNWVVSVAFSPDGMRISSGSHDHTIRVWDAQSGKQLLDPFEGHTDGVTSVAFSPDGRRIVSGSRDKAIRLWETQTGKTLLHSLEGHTESVTSVAFSPDGTRIVSGSEDKTIRVWDAQTGKYLLDFLGGGNNPVYSVAFSPDSTRIVSSSYGRTIRVWDALTGKPLLDPFKGHTNSISSVAFSPDGTRIVSGSYDKTIRVWDAQTAVPLNPLNGHHQPVTSVNFSFDGTSIISGSEDNTVQVWDAQTGRPLLDPLQGHTNSVISTAFSPDGLRIVSGSYNNTIRVWDAQTGKLLHASPEGHTGAIYSVSFSSDSTRIVSGAFDNTVRLWSAQTGKPLLDALEGHTHSVLTVAFSPEGLRVVSGSADKTIRLWDAQTGKPLLGPLKGHTDYVQSVAFSPDGMYVVSGSCDTTIRVWDAQSGQPLLDPFKGHTHWVQSAAFSSDGMRIISSSHDKTIRVWDAQTGDTLFEPLKGHGDWLDVVAFSPDGTRAVSGSTDTAIRVWDLEKSVPLSKPSMQVSDNVSSPGPWHLGENGWVLDEQERRLLWLPLDLRDRVLLPNMTLLIAPEGSVTLDFTEAMVGESWAECYVPRI